MRQQTAWSQGAGVVIDDNAGAGDLYTTYSADRIMSLIVAASYGIRYSVSLIDDLTSLLEVQALDLAVVNENRWVYRFDGVIWEMFFQLDAAHNHDVLYAPLDHDHDGIYAYLNHEHDYAPVVHNHDGYYLAWNGTAENSRTVMGSPPSTLADPSTVTIRNSSGDIYARLFRSTYAEQTSAPATSADIAFRNNDVSDNYIRFMTNAAFSSWCQNASIKTYDSARLGGVAASSYLRSNTNDTFTGVLTLAGQLYINDSNCRILEGSTNTIRIQANGSTTDIGTRNSSWSHFSTTGTSGFYFYSALTAPDFKLSSDIRFKKRIKAYESGLDKVLDLKPVTFHWDEKKEFQGKARKGEDIGFIAQWTEKVEPLLVSTDSDGFKSIKYNKIVTLAVAGLQEFYFTQDEWNSNIEKRIDKIEQKLGLN